MIGSGLMLFIQLGGDGWDIKTRWTAGCGRLGVDVWEWNSGSGGMVVDGWSGQLG